MKRCPECRRDYHDETLLYCLDDGTALLEGPASGGDARTEILPSDSNPFGEKPTKILESDTSEQRVAAPSTDSLNRKVGKRKFAVVGVAAVLLAAVIGGGWMLRNYLTSSGATVNRFQNSTLTRITTSGRAQEATISPDGKFIVYLEMADDGNRGLWVKQIATGNAIPIVPPTKGNVLKGTTFSRDGNFVYYLFTDRTRRLSLYQVSAVGGTPRKIIDVCDSPVAVSPDGQKLAFLRWSGASSGDVVIANADGSNEKVLASLGDGKWFTSAGASWSPDGKTIAITSGISIDGSDQHRLLGIDTNDGSLRELTAKRWLDAGRVEWMPDGSSIILIATEKADGLGGQVWQVENSSGSATRITNDVHGRDDTSLGITQDGRTLVTVTQQRLSRIESIPSSGHTGRIVRLSGSESNIDGHHGLDVLADGRIVFASNEGGQSDIWIMNGDGSGRRKLTSDVYVDADPSVSPDDRVVVFRSNRPDGEAIPRLWRMNIDGSGAGQIVSRSETSGSFSADGQTVIFSSYAGDGSQVLKRVSINGGEPTSLTDYPVFESSYSPDGKLIGAYYSDQQGSRSTYGIMPAEAGPMIRKFEFPSFQYEWVRWTRDGKNLSFIGAPPDPSNIWLQPAEGGEPRKLTDFKSDYIFRHVWSRDGKTLHVVRGRPSFDVVLQTTQ